MKALRKAECRFVREIGVGLAPCVRTTMPLAQHPTCGVTPVRPLLVHHQVAAFLRTQHDNLDKAQLGELLGHHDDFALAVMHAWIDSEPSMTGQAIDQSLRRLLGGFRLPGEAQKIDRIMEKFAEVRAGGSAYGGGGRCWPE